MSAQNDSKVPRRQFLQTAAAATAGFTIVPRHVLAGSGQVAPSDRFNVAGVGIGGMGRANLTNLASQNIVALCDVDWGYAGAAFDKLGADAAQMEERLSRPPATAAAGGDPAVAARQAEMRQRNVEQVANMKRLVGGLRQGRQVLRLPRDAREAEGHRRRGGRHARSPARRHRAGRDGSRQARLRAEAAHLVGRRGAPAREEGRRHEARHADGQPGPLLRRCAAGERAHLGRHHRRGARGARLDEPPARLLAAGHSAARGRQDRGGGPAAGT